MQIKIADGTARAVAEARGESGSRQAARPARAPAPCSLSGGCTEMQLSSLSSARAASHRRCLLVRPRRAPRGSVVYGVSTGGTRGEPCYKQQAHVGRRRRKKRNLHRAVNLGKTDPPLEAPARRAIANRETFALLLWVLDSPVLGSWRFFFYWPEPAW